MAASSRAQESSQAARAADTRPVGRCWAAKRALHSCRDGHFRNSRTSMDTAMPRTDGDHQGRFASVRRDVSRRRREDGHRCCRARLEEEAYVSGMCIRHRVLYGFCSDTLNTHSTISRGNVPGGSLLLIRKRVYVFTAHFVAQEAALTR